MDPLVGTGHFDFVGDLGAQMPMRVIGMLLGIPDDDHEAVRDRANANLRTEAGKPMKITANAIQHLGDNYAAYIDWRAEHPSDDIMTELLTVEFEDETGTTRRLRRDELLTYINVVATAGNETTTKLIGWMGKVLAEHPEQRRALVENPALIPARDRGTAALRVTRPPVRAHGHPRRRVLRPDRAGRRRHGVAHRRGLPRPSALPTGR